MHACQARRPSAELLALLGLARCCRNRGVGVHRGGPLLQQWARGRTVLLQDFHGVAECGLSLGQARAQLSVLAEDLTSDHIPSQRDASKDLTGALVEDLTSKDISK